MSGGRFTIGQWDTSLQRAGQIAVGGFFVTSPTQTVGGAAMRMQGATVVRNPVDH